MDNIYDFEQRLKLASDQQTISPPPFVWKNINNELRPKRKNRFLLFFLASLGISAACWFIISNANTPNPDVRSSIVVADETQVEETLSPERVEVEEDLISAESMEPVTRSSNNNVEPKTGNTTLNNNKSSASGVVVLESKSNEDVLIEDKEGYSKVVAEPLLDETAFLPLISPVSIEINERNEILMPKRVACPTFNRRSKLNMFVEGSLIGGLPVFSFSNDANEELTNLREASESNWYSWGGNISLGVHFNKKLYAGAGLEFMQHKQKFNHSTPSITKMIITFDEVTGEPIDTSFVTGSIQSKGEIRHNTFEIPMFIGYTQALGSWNIGGEVGPLFNVSISSKGKMFEEALNISRVEDQDGVYESSLGLGFKAAFVVQNHLGNGWAFFVKPSAKWYANDMTVSKYPTKVKLSSYYISIGLKKYL